MSVPQLRFKGFSDKWTSKKIKEATSYVDYRGKTPQKSDNGFFLVTAKNIRMGYIDYDASKEYISHDDFDEVMRRGKVKIGDVVITTEAPVGYVANIDRENIALAQRVIKLRGNQDCLDNYFLKYLLLSNTFQKDLLEKSTGGTVKGIKGSILHCMILQYPSVPEQTKIANFLTTIDERINQLTHKKELMTQCKQGVMQKIFSQQLRFKDDNGEDFGDWEEKRLGEVCVIKRGASPRPISDPKWFCQNSKVGWVRISDVTKSDKYLRKTEQYLTPQGIEKSRLVSSGNIIMSICATIGKPIYTTFDVCIHDGFVVFEGLSVDAEYFYYYLIFIEKNWYQYGQPGSQVNLNSDIVSNEIMLVPPLPEQSKIANFLTALDEKIQHIAKQIEATKQYKQGLLQQMFV